MKSTTKLMTLLLVVLLTLAMTTTAFAQNVATGNGGSGTITITNAATSQTYTLYKIFDATVSTDGNIAYTYDGTLGTNDYFVQDATTGAITATNAAKDSGGNLTADAIAFLGTIKGAAAATAKATDNTLKFTGLEYGYYYVESTLDSGKAVTVTSTKPDASIIDKNDSEPTTPDDPDPDDPTNGGAKVVAESSAEVGETIHYTVTFTATNYLTENAETKQITKYVITDTASGVELNSDIVVKVDGQTVTAATSFDTNGKLTLTWANNAGASIYNSPATVVITYSGVVTEDALTAGKATNNAVVSYVTAPDDPGDDEPDPEPINPDDPAVETMVFSIDITKVDFDDNTKKLDGAKFVLKNNEGKFYKYDAENDDVTWVDNQTDADEVTTVNGEAKFEGLKAGSYDLVETKAPSGYNLPSAPFAIVITEKSDNTFSATNAGETANISNTTATTICRSQRPR